MAKKIKIPKDVLELKLSKKKFAKKHGLPFKKKDFKGVKAKRRKELEKSLNDEYAKKQIVNLNWAIKIISTNPPDNKKVVKLRSLIDNIIFDNEVMERMWKIYRKDPKAFPNLDIFPYMITSTIMYYNQEGITEEEKKYGDKLDKEALLKFCEKILSSQIKHYGKYGLADNVAFELATVIPNTKIIKSDSNASRQWYRKLIQKLYTIAEYTHIDLLTVFEAVRKVSGKKGEISRNKFHHGFFSEFILTKFSNKFTKFNDQQKELQENLIEAALIYLDSLKAKDLREVLKTYIRKRKRAEEFKNDSKRVIKFIDCANSNSKYNQLKAVLQELIETDPNNSLYLS